MRPDTRTNCLLAAPFEQFSFHTCAESGLTHLINGLPSPEPFPKDQADCIYSLNFLQQFQ